MEDIAARWTMTQIHLDVIATIPEVVQCDFVDAALRAKANCPTSRSLNANISMRARLSAHPVTEVLPRKKIPARHTPGILRKKRFKRDGAKT